MRKGRISPKKSTLKDLEGFIDPADTSLNTPVISDYATLPASYQRRNLKPSYQGYSFNANEREEGLDLGIRGIGAKGSIPVDIPKGKLAFNPELTGVNVSGSRNNQQIFSENTLEPSLGVTYSPNERLQFGVKGKSLASDRRGVEAGMRYKFKDGGETDPPTKTFLEDLDYANKYGSYSTNALRKYLIKEPGMTVTLPDSARYDEIQKLFDYVNSSKRVNRDDTLQYNTNVGTFNELFSNPLVAEDLDIYASKLNPASSTPTTSYKNAKKLQKEIKRAENRITNQFTGDPLYVLSGRRANRKINPIHLDYPYYNDPNTGEVVETTGALSAAKAKMMGHDLLNRVNVNHSVYSKTKDPLMDPLMYNIKVDAPIEPSKEKETKTMAVPKMGIEERPVKKEDVKVTSKAGDIKMPGGSMTEEAFIKRYGQKVWDAQNQNSEYQNGGLIPSYKDGGETDPTDPVIAKQDNTAVNILPLNIEKEMADYAKGFDEFGRSYPVYQDPGTINESIQLNPNLGFTRRAGESPQMSKYKEGVFNDEVRDAFIDAGAGKLISGAGKLLTGRISMKGYKGMGSAARGSKFMFDFPAKKGNFYRQLDATNFADDLSEGVIKGQRNVTPKLTPKGKINLAKSFGDDAYFNKNSLYYRKRQIPGSFLYEAQLPESSFIGKLNKKTLKWRDGAYRTKSSHLPLSDPIYTRVPKNLLKFNDPNINKYEYGLKGWQQLHNYRDGGETDPRDIKVDQYGNSFNVRDIATNFHSNSNTRSYNLPQSSYNRTGFFSSGEKQAMFADNPNRIFVDDPDKRKGTQAYEDLSNLSNPDYSEGDKQGLPTHIRMQKGPMAPYEFKNGGETDPPIQDVTYQDLKEYRKAVQATADSTQNYNTAISDYEFIMKNAAATDSIDRGPTFYDLDNNAFKSGEYDRAAILAERKGIPGKFKVKENLDYTGTQNPIGTLRMINDSTGMDEGEFEFYKKPTTNPMFVDTIMQKFPPMPANKIEPRRANDLAGYFRGAKLATVDTKLQPIQSNFKPKSVGYTSNTAAGYPMIQRGGGTGRVSKGAYWVPGRGYKYTND